MRISEVNFSILISKCSRLSNSKRNRMYLLFPGEYLHFDDPGKLLSIYLLGLFIRKADYLELVGVRNHDFRNWILEKLNKGKSIDHRFDKDVGIFT